MRKTDYIIQQKASMSALASKTQRVQEERSASSGRTLWLLPNSSFPAVGSESRSLCQNINDLKDEGTGNKLFEVTIRWKNLEWAFACTESDYQGHATSQHSKHQHYHLQMRLDGRPFINYSDFHLPFSEMDVINIEAMRANPIKLKQRFSFGEGMSEVLSDETLEHIVNSSVSTDSEDDGTFKLDTIVMAEEGKTISGGDLYALIQEAKAKGVTMASLMHKLPNASTRVIVTPGPGVVEQAPRAGRKSDA